MKGIKNVLPWYGLLLIVLICASLMVKEGFGNGSTSSTIKDKKVLLVVHSKDCGHCVELMKVWKPLASKNGDKMADIRSDTTDAEDKALLETLHINAYPSFFIMDHGKSTPLENVDRTESGLKKQINSL